MSNKKIPPFKIITKKKSNGEDTFRCNICNHPFKQAFLNEKNENNHKKTPKHKIAVDKLNYATSIQKGIFSSWAVVKKPTKTNTNTNTNNSNASNTNITTNNSNTNNSNTNNSNTNNCNTTNNSNTPNNSNTNNCNTNNSKSGDSSDDDILEGLVGRESELRMPRNVEEKSFELCSSSDEAVFFVSILESFETIHFEQICDYLTQRDLRKASYTNRNMHKSCITYMNRIFGDVLLNNLIYDQTEPVDSNVLVEPTSLRVLKQLIINYFDNCIHFFEKSGREHYKCNYCIENIDIAKRYAVNGIRGAINDGALARKQNIWYHLIGIHRLTQRHEVLTNKEFDDEWVTVQTILTDDETAELLKIHGWKSAMINWVDNHADEFFINLNNLSIRCNICYEAYQLFSDESKVTIWTEGRSVDKLRQQQLTQHLDCDCHGDNNKALLAANAGEQGVEVKENEIELDSSAHVALQNRIRTILWMLDEKLPPHRFKSTMKLLQAHGTPNLGVSGTSSTVVHKMFHMCGVYIGTIYIHYILKYVTAMCLGVDCVKTSDDIKVCHFNLRFVCEAYPITIHFGSRKIVGTCDGAKLLKTLQNLVEWRDLDDVNYVGVSVGKTYYELDDEKEIKHLINVIAKMKESGMKISFNWFEFIEKLSSMVSDGGGDVFGKNIGLRGRLKTIKKDQCGVELMTTHGICHKIDIIARDHFLICSLFAETIDFITTFRSFINASEFRINYYRQECINHCAKYLVIARKFETRWIIATYQALKAWKSNYKATIFFLEECKNDIINKCSKIDDRNRITAKIESLTNGICSMKSHMMAYGVEDLMRPVATKWQAMSESEALNVIGAINDVNQLERVIGIKKTNIDRDSRMFQWQIDFHDENMFNHIPHGKRRQDMVYRWDKYDFNGYYHFKEFTQRQYSTVREQVKKMYIECCDELLAEIKKYKDEEQFKHWYEFKNIADYTLWQLNTSNVSVAKSYIQNRSKSSIASLYKAKYQTFVKMGMPPCSKEEFITAIVEAQEQCIDAIESFRVDKDNNATLVKIYQRKDIDFYDIWSIVYGSIGDNHPFKYVYDYFISINPGNPFSERQGRIMNIVRNKLASNTKMHLLDTKLHGHFNLPSNIIDPIHQTHIDTLVWIWRNVIRGHDIVKPNNLQKQLDLSIKMPKITAKSYYKCKRNIKKEKTKTTIWQKIKKVGHLMQRSFQNRGKK